jgi:hypothetical protein
MYLLPLVPRVQPQQILVPILLLHSMRHLGMLMVVSSISSELNVQPMFAAESGKPDTSVEQRVQELTPKLNDYVAIGMSL